VTTDVCVATVRATKSVTWVGASVAGSDAETAGGAAVSTSTFTSRSDDFGGEVRVLVRGGALRSGSFRRAGAPGVIASSTARRTASSKLLGRGLSIAALGRGRAASCLVSVVASGSESLLALGDSVEPGESSAHAGALLQPVTIATPTPRATANPPTRPMHASLGIRYVYRLGSGRRAEIIAAPIRSRGLATSTTARSIRVKPHRMTPGGAS
jgi:hypothetical protein